MPLYALSKTEIQEWFDDCGQDHPRWANMALGLLRVILNHAVRHGVLVRNPAKEVKLRPRNKPGKALSDEQIGELLAALDLLPPALETWSVIIRLILFTGCRNGEILSLKWCDIRWNDVHGTTLSLGDSKTGAREILLGPMAYALLVRQKQRQSEDDIISDYVFPAPSGPDEHRYQVLGSWDKFRKKMGWDGLRIHDLRHTFCSKAARDGIPLPEIQRLMGHSSSETTLGYIHFDNDFLKAAAERVSPKSLQLLFGGSNIDDLICNLAKVESSLESLVIARIKHSKAKVFRNEDFKDLGSYMGIAGVFRTLRGRKVLKRVGWGLYALTEEAATGEDQSTTGGENRGGVKEETASEGQARKEKLNSPVQHDLPVHHRLCGQGHGSRVQDALIRAQGEGVCSGGLTLFFCIALTFGETVIAGIHPYGIESYMIAPLSMK
jgi:site-specific recombinase XerD